LLCLRPWERHAEVERVKESTLGDPRAPLDKLLVHDRGLPRRPPKADESELQPEANRMAFCRFRRSSRLAPALRKCRISRHPEHSFMPCGNVRSGLASAQLRFQSIPRGRKSVARKTVVVSDMSGEQIQDGKGAKVRITFDDARSGSIEMDVTAEEARAMGAKGRPVARRGRKPKGS
jgi:hypothetical protein